jgi:hypothetical protein
MNSRRAPSFFLAIAMLCMAAGSHAQALTPAEQTKVKVLKTQLKKLPNEGAPQSKITSLVKKLVKLIPDQAGQMYAIGLRKSGTEGAAGIAYSKRLNKIVQNLVRNSGLSGSDIASMIRRLNKIQRLYVPPAPEPTPPPYSM